MAVNPYATLEDLQAYLGAEPPPESARLLTRAQDLVAAALTSSMYTVDAAGENPTDANVIAALNKATCAQVEDWIINGDETSSLDKLGSYTMDGVSANRAGGARKFRLCDRALDALRAGKLMPGTVVTN